MKHQWKTDADGKVVPLDEWADHPITQCALCGQLSGCLNAEPFCTAIGAEPLLDADDCEGLDLNVTVSIRISHPGKAEEYADGDTVAMSTILPLEQVLQAKHDLTVSALGNLVEVVAGSWRGARTAHEAAWRTAVEAASGCSAKETTEAGA